MERSVVYAGDIPADSLRPALPGNTANVGSFNINLVPNASLSGNAAALAAFQRAADAWEAVLADPITVTINAGLAALPAGVIGSASSVQLGAGDLNVVRNAMVGDNFGGPLQAVTDALPTAATASFLVSAGDSIGGLGGTKANLKALGFTGLDGSFGASDATITFSTSFPFDFDNSNGVTASTMDFETVALHEIGHALGFVSAVDVADTSGPTAFLADTLDMFRFQDGGVNDPASLAEFTSKPRFMAPAGTAIFDFILGQGSVPAELGLSTGASTGDGRQASHWKDNDLTGNYIGVMDPTLGFQEVRSIEASDMVALDLIGWNVVPEPGEYAAAFGVAALGFAAWRRRGARRA